MKAKHFFWVLALSLVLITPHCVGATLVWETTGWITGSGSESYSFVADKEPYTYQATLADLSVAPWFGFDFLFLQVSTSTKIAGSIGSPGSFTFIAEPGKTYFASVFGNAINTGANTGYFGVEIKTIPIPATLMLLGSSLVGMMVIRRKQQ